MMAYYHEEGYLCYYEQQQPGLGLDNPGGYFRADAEVGIELLADHLSLVIEPSSSESWDRSTGYLEDAVGEWSDRCKRRRTLQFQGEHAGVFPAEIERMENLLEELLNWNSAHGDLVEELSNFSDTSKNNPGVCLGCSISSYDDSLTVATISETEPDPRFSSATSITKKLTAPTEAATTTTCRIKTSKPMSLSTSAQSPNHFSPLIKGSQDSAKKRKKKKLDARGVLCPFTVIKPAGVDGSLTLDEINERLLRRPTRPVRHPVGEFACLPCVSTVAGPGLSGKAVVGLTRIHTQGRGTVTIIRTKG